MGRQASQSRYLTDSGGCVLVDFVGRYEALERDYHHVCRTVGIEPRELPRLKQSPRRPFPERYTPALAARVVGLLQADFELFGYPVDPAAEG